LEKTVLLRAALSQNVLFSRFCRFFFPLYTALYGFLFSLKGKT